MREVNVLLVEDNLDDAELVVFELEHGGLAPRSRRVDNRLEFRAALADQVWDVIVSDFNMPSFTAIGALEELKASGKDIPFIIVSGSVGEAVAVEAMKAGAHDFFVKHQLALLPAAIEREIREATMRRDRHRAVAELTRAEERYRLLVDNVRDHAIFMLAPDGNVASWNRGAEHVTGFREHEVIGRPFSTFYPDGEGAAIAATKALVDARNNGAHGSEGLRQRRDGAVFWASSTIDCIRPERDVLGYSVILRDVTERKRLLDDLRQSIVARDEFLSIASHELKTPLTSLELQLELLAHLRALDGDVRLSDSRVQAKLEAVKRQVDRIALLINNLLDVTRITAGCINLKREPVDLAQVVEAVMSRMRDAIERAQSHITVHVETPVLGNWDRLRLDSVVANLLSNAVKYGAGKPIDISLCQEGDRVSLSVQDRGIGISPQEEARIFERFERAVPEQHYGGFGLGLWVVRVLVEAHGGSVRVVSTIGEGSTFSIDLPLGVGEAK